MGFWRDLGRALGLIDDEPAPRQGAPARQTYNPPNYHWEAIDYLYHMTHINNLPSILERGLLSHSQAHQSNAVTDISDRNVNDRRSWMSVDGKLLHDYAPLYFNPKNPMLFRRREIQGNIAILAFSKRLMLNDGTLFTDGNAASNATTFYGNLTSLSKLDWECIWREYWNDYPDGRRIRCAEILIPGGIHPSWIEKIIVRDAGARSNILRRVRPNVSVEIQPWRYF